MPYVPINRKLLQQLAERHLGDAQVLFEQKRWPGAYYLAGYSVECALKACIAKRTREHDFPRRDSLKAFTHRFETLVGLAELETARVEKCKNSRLFDLYWTNVSRWSEESRYDSAKGEQEARDLIKAISDNKGASVDQTTLVEPDISAGRKLVEALDSNLQVEAAFWWMEDDTWRLLLVTPLVHEQGPLFVYSRVRDVIESLTELPRELFHRIEVVSPSAGVVTVLDVGGRGNIPMGRLFSTNRSIAFTSPARTSTNSHPKPLPRRPERRPRGL